MLETINGDDKEEADDMKAWARGPWLDRPEK